MIIIADSGSTKTDWRLIAKEGVVEAVQTAGLNPHIISEADFKKELQNSALINWSVNDVEKVYFYGAGITGIKLQENVANWLKRAFSVQDIVTASDLLAAARAIYGSDEGIVGILGTGSNSGYYNGTKVERSIPALGYMIGDEGSGNALGKHLITAFLRAELPSALASEFKTYYPDYGNLLSNIYRAVQPARLLASFVPFIHQHREVSFVAGLINDEFTKYFNLLSRYNPITDVGLIGSVAHYFSRELTQVANEQGINLFKIKKSPIDALTLYHQAEIS